MRRTISLLVSVGLAVMLFSGAALAATITGTNGHDIDDQGGQSIYGTAEDDTIYALAGNDYVNALEGVGS